MSRDSTGETGIFGQGLPGTGGDLQPTDLDVEGHGAPEPTPADATPADAAQPTGSGSAAVDQAADDPDTEGHLYRTGSLGGGELIRRAPGENPHGER